LNRNAKFKQSRDTKKTDKRKNPFTGYYFFGYADESWHHVLIAILSGFSNRYRVLIFTRTKVSVFALHHSEGFMCGKCITTSLSKQAVYASIHK